MIHDGKKGGGIQLRAHQTSMEMSQCLQEPYGSIGPGRIAIRQLAGQQVQTKY